jgi:hypothetical protein
MGKTLQNKIDKWDREKIRPGILPDGAVVFP